jgi:anaerobic ribonucleoside-triphosphate reductase
MKDKKIGEGVPFTHIARITGYLATTKRFNSAKLHELNDRVKHDISVPRRECKSA